MEAALRSKSNKHIDVDAACEEGPWSTKVPRPGHKIINARLDKIAQDCSYPGDGTEQINLPCGHVLNYNSAAIKQADPAELETAACPECGIQILNDRDRAEIAWKEEARVRDDYEDHQSSWCKLDCVSLGDATLRLDKATFLRAVMEAVRSLRLPRSVVPKQLALMDMEETNTAFEAIRNWMDRRYWPMEGRATALQERLKNVIEQCLRKSDDTIQRSNHPDAARLGGLHNPVAAPDNDLAGPQGL